MMNDDIETYNHDPEWCCGPNPHVLRAEVERLREIRDLLVQSVVRATGADEDAVREAPLTCAIRHAEEVERLRDALTSANDDYADSKAEVERLRAETDMLRADLAEAREYGDRWRNIANGYTEEKA
jgi:predicted  nucleic acid-binding Zn-ribbon protein